MDKGDHDESFMAKLESTYTSGQVAARLSDLLTERITVATYGKMKEDIDTLNGNGYQLTENVCRLWCAQCAENHLAKGQIAEYLDVIRVWMVPGESRPEDQSEFDTSCPRMWQVAPTLSDEQALDEEVDAKPENAAEVREWEMGRAFDKSVRGFGTFYMNAWACDSLYQLLRTDLTKVETIMSKWIEHEAYMDKSVLGERALEAVATVTVFANACMAVISKAFLTAEAHNDFVQVFIPGKAKQPTGRAEFFRLLAVTCRKHPKWKDLESRTVGCAAREILVAPLAKSALAVFNAGAVSFDHVDDIMKSLPVWKEECREGALDHIEGAVRSWLIKKVSEITTEAADAHIEDILLQDLAKLKDHLAFFDDAESQKARDSAGETFQQVAASASTHAILNMAVTDDFLVSNADFISKVDALPQTLPDEVQTALEDIGRKFHEGISEMAAKILTEDDSELIYQGIANLTALGSRVALKGSLPKLMKTLVDKAIVVRTVFRKYTSIPNSTTTVALNRAVLAFKAVILKKDEQTEFMVQFLRSCLGGLAPALEAHSKVQSEKVCDCQSELQMQIDDLAAVCKGARDGSSWKAGIDDSWSLKQVLDQAHVAKGLLAGPGAKVIGAKALLAEVDQLAALAVYVFLAEHARCVVCMCFCCIRAPCLQPGISNEFQCVFIICVSPSGNHEVQHRTLQVGRGCPQEPSGDP